MYKTGIGRLKRHPVPFVSLFPIHIFLRPFSVVRGANPQDLLKNCISYFLIQWASGPFTVSSRGVDSPTCRLVTLNLLAPISLFSSSNTVISNSTHSTGAEEPFFISPVKAVPFSVVSYAKL